MTAAASAIPHTLVAEAQRGDRQAREDLVRRLGPLVWSLCRADREPDDAYQAAWERVLEALPRFVPDAGASLATWVACITHRVLIDRYRYRARRPEIALVHAPPADDDVERDVGRARRDARFRALIDTLPEDQRRVVLAHYLGDIPLQQLAEDEGVALGTIKSRLFRAKAVLARRSRSLE